MTLKLSSDIGQTSSRKQDYQETIKEGDQPSVEQNDHSLFCFFSFVTTIMERVEGPSAGMLTWERYTCKSGANEHTGSANSSRSFNFRPGIRLEEGGKTTSSILFIAQKETTDLNTFECGLERGLAVLLDEFVARSGLQLRLRRPVVDLQVEELGRNDAARAHQLTRRAAHKPDLLLFSVSHQEARTAKVCTVQENRQKTSVLLQPCAKPLFSGHRVCLLCRQRNSPTAADAKKWTHPDPGNGLLMLGELGGVWLSFAFSSIPPPPPLLLTGGADWGGEPDALPPTLTAGAGNSVCTTSSRSTDVDGTAPTTSIGPMRTS